MFGEIIQGLLDELQELFKDTGATVLLNTHFSKENMPLYKMPVCILDISDSPETSIMIGGTTRMDWNFKFKIYVYEPNPNVDIDNGYSTSLLNQVDIIRRHFSNYEILTTSYQSIIDNYNFILTLNGINSAPAIMQDGLTIGFSINFESCAIDTDTSTVQTSTVLLEHVYRVSDNPILSTDQEEINFKASGEEKTLQIISNTFWYLIFINTDWITVDYMSGFGNKEITFTASENNTDDVRDVTVFIYCPLTELDEVEVILLQEAS